MESGDIIVSESNVVRHLGLSGRVVRSEHRGVSAVLENGERVRLWNNQFNYISEDRVQDLSWNRDDQNKIN